MLIPEILAQRIIRSPATIGDKPNRQIRVLPPLVIGLTVVAFGTSAPELTVSVGAAWTGASDLALGNVVGSTILNVLCILGIAGLIAFNGYDGFMYSVGWLVAYVTVLLVIAEPCRNIGRYTMGDILAFRNNPRVVRACMAVSTITVSTFLTLSRSFFSVCGQARPLPPLFRSTNGASFQGNMSPACMVRRAV